MIEDPDIRRGALYMIEKHGAPYAAPAASRHAQELVREHQANAAEIWRQIAQAIVELSMLDEG